MPLYPRHLLIASLSVALLSTADADLSRTANSDASWSSTVQHEARATRGIDRGSSEAFEVQRLAPGVYASIRREPPSLYFESNSVFIVGDNDVIVVDAQFSIASARQTLAALRKITNKPVKYVVNTHGHDDHMTGNQVYRDAFPGVEFIAHRSTRDTMVEVGAKKREEFLKSLPGTIGYFRSLLVSGKGVDGSPITDEERAGLASDSTLASRFLTEAPQLELVPATTVVDDKLTLHQGKRVIDILYLGGGHSAGDLVVSLPKEGIVVAGDLVVSPVPLVGSTSHPAAFANALERLRALKPAIIVPGHGAIQRDDAYVRQVERMLTYIRDAVASGVAKGDSLPQLQKSIKLDEFEAQFAGSSKLKRFTFLNYVTLSSIPAAYADAKATKGASHDQTTLTPTRSVNSGRRGSR